RIPEEAKPRLAGLPPQVRRLEPAARPAVAPQHRPGIRDAIVRESHRAAAGEPDRLILHAPFLPSAGTDRPVLHRRSTCERFAAAACKSLIVSVAVTAVIWQ